MNTTLMKPYQCFLVCFVIIVTFGLQIQISYAQNGIQEILDAHNAARAAVGVGNLEWDDQIAAVALEAVTERIGNCAIITIDNTPYGLNLAIGPDVTGVSAVNKWVDNQQYYDYITNTCSVDTLICEAYINVVSKYSFRVGCAISQCDSSDYYEVCLYDPPHPVGELPY